MLQIVSLTAALSCLLFLPSCRPEGSREVTIHVRGMTKVLGIT